MHSQFASKSEFRIYDLTWYWVVNTKKPPLNTFGTYIIIQAAQSLTLVNVLKPRFNWIILAKLNRRITGFDDPMKLARRFLVWVPTRYFRPRNWYLWVTCRVNASPSVDSSCISPEPVLQLRYRPWLHEHSGKGMLTNGLRLSLRVGLSTRGLDNDY